jgi:hypothetical protein
MAASKADHLAAAETDGLPRSARVGDEPVARQGVPVWTWPLVLVAAALSLFATHHGPGLSNDSTDYVSAGLNFARGAGLRNFSGVEITIFPPGLPLIVAAGTKLSMGAATVLRVLDAVAFGLTVLVGVLLLRRHVASPWLVFGAATLIVFSYHLFSIEFMSWSEPLFVATCAAFLLVLETACRAARPTRWLFGAAVLANTAFLLRYAGLALIPVGVAALVVDRYGDGWVRACRAAVLFGLLSGIAPVVVMAHNHAVDGSLMGPRIPSQVGLRATLESFVSVVGSWMLPLQAPRSAHKVVGAVLVLLAGLILALGLGLAIRSRRRRDVPSIAPLLTFTLVYSFFIVASSVTTFIDRPSDRFLSPLFVPLVVLGAIALEYAGTRRVGSYRTVGLAVVALAILGLAADNAASTVREAARLHGKGTQYTTSVWRRSQLATEVKKLPDTVVVYSDAPRGLWAVSHHQPIYFPPAHVNMRLERVTVHSRRLLMQTAACRPTYLAWFWAYGDGVSSPTVLANYVTVSPVRTLRDGTLYRIGGASPPRKC